MCFIPFDLVDRERIGKVKFVREDLWTSPAPPPVTAGVPS